MPALTPRERLQPSLLDRLTDDEPGEQVEPREHRVLSMRRLRQAVLRDLTSLLNTTNLASAQADLGEHLMVDGSVINYGMPELAGRTASGLRMEDIERNILQAVWNFEPRIQRSSLRVTAVATREEGNAYNVIRFDIEGDLWALPYPERLYLKTELDLETGAVRIGELLGAR